MKKIKLLTSLTFASTVLAGVLASCSGSVASETTTTPATEAKTVYVSANATPDGDGTEAKPYTFVNAYTNAVAGTTILMEAGTYSYSSRLELGKEIDKSLDVQTGKAGKYITVKPKTDDARVVFDFSSMTFDGTNRGIQIYSDFWHFIGIEVCGAGDNGMYIAGSHNIIENCQFYNNRDTGLQLGRAYSSDNTIDLWPSYNLIKNCTSFDNYDDETFGENADGYAAKLTVGYGNTFDGCIAFRNSDDGWDLFAKVDSGDIGTVVLYNCVSFENGFLSYKNDYEKDSKKGTYDTLNGDGIGFKLGGSVMKGNVIVENCLAFNNKLHGVGDNSNPGVIGVKNFTAFNNCANVDADGKITGKRGIPDTANKSNNIDLARSTSSYNNYYGIVSYVNNQAGFSTDNDSSYNSDAFRGATAYSIFNTEYNNGEVYVAFTGYEDASSWSSDTVDTSYSQGTGYSRMNDSMFADLTAINAVCENRAGLTNLLSIHKTYRNADGSVNMHDKMKIVDNELLTFANGKPIGAQLSKSSYSEYTHSDMYLFDGEKDSQITGDALTALSAYSITKIIGNSEAIYQNFLLPRVIAGADISWKSSNENVVEIDNNEKLSMSGSVFSTAVIHVPQTDTKVTMTATITSNQLQTTKEFEIIVKSRHQNLGELVSSADKAIRVSLYGEYAEPRITALDASAITVSEFPASLYDITNTYKYAVDGKSKFYNIDNVYTSVAGVYEVTATATLKADANIKSQFVYKVYVVDPDSNIDFIPDTQTITLSSKGFDISGELSNIEGSVIAYASKTELNITKASELLAIEGVQEVKIVTDSIIASFEADNSSDNGSTQYIIYYSVVNGNKSANTNDNEVYSKKVTVANVETRDQFYSLARLGKIDGITADTTTIYSLTGDLDFEGYDWSTKETVIASPATKVGNFSGLFRGNGHTIKNITAEHKDGSIAKSINVFFKVKDGTIMDVNFDNIKFVGNDESKQIGIIGELQGGYVSNVHVTRVSASGKESAGGIIGQVSGGDNHIIKCSFVNPIGEKLTDAYLTQLTTNEAHAASTFVLTEEELAESNASSNYVIAVKNKYAGGIIGNAQMNNDQVEAKIPFNLEITNCYVNAVIGDGGDASGNMGLILGRCKNDNDLYTTNISKCVAYGMVISNGQYTSGIVGDFDNGGGSVNIESCFSDVSFIFKRTYLNAYEAYKNNAEAQQYAHKNSNPIVGRAVASTGIYDTNGNIGSWTEYYSTNINSASIVFNLSNYEDSGKFVTITTELLNLILDLDFENVWKLENGVITLK